MLEPLQICDQLNRSQGSERKQSTLFSPDQSLSPDLLSFPNRKRNDISVLFML